MRLVGHLLPDIAGDAIVIAEQAADGVVPDGKREQANIAIEELHRQFSRDDARCRAVVAAKYATWRDGRGNHGEAEGAGYTIGSVADALALEAGWRPEQIDGRGFAAPMLRHILRDIFGNPFRPVTLDPHWLSSTVLDLARTIYEKRAFERLPILADALMDAGCDSEEIINHCHSEGLHVRGCWVVDLLLGKE